MISQTIRTEFAESTLLVIAHRLRTIADFDRVMVSSAFLSLSFSLLHLWYRADAVPTQVLDRGNLVEYDSPAKLLEDTSSRFYALCRASGKSEFRVLKKMAEGKLKVSHKTKKVRRTTSKNADVTVESQE